MSDNRDNTEDRNGADDRSESWLTESVEGDRDPADLLRLRQLLQSLSPPEPDEAAWDAVLARVHESVAEPAVRRRASRWWWGIVGLTAAVVLAGLLARSLWPTTAPTPLPPVEEPFPVVEAGDVTIISMDARDVACLVVGEPPITGELEFVRQEDIRVIRCECCPHSGRSARLEPGEEVPMFVAAVVEQPSDNDPEN